MVSFVYAWSRGGRFGAVAAFAAACLMWAAAPAPAAAQTLQGPVFGGELNRPVPAAADPGRRTGRVLNSVGLVGDWDGTYFDCATCRPDGSVPFEVSLFAGENGVTGDSIERNTFAPARVGSLFAFWRGDSRDGAVRLIKTYDGTGGVNHEVEYIGRFETPDLILGRWRVGRTSGRFEMVRRRDRLN